MARKKKQVVEVEEEKPTTTLKTQKEKEGLVTNYDPDELEGEVELLVALDFTKDLKKEVLNITHVSRQEMKCLVDSYYQAQKRRIEIQNQIRALKQDADDTNSDANCIIMDWQLKNAIIQEKGIQKALKVICERDEIGAWLMSIKGIGPTIAAGLIAYFDIEGVEHFSQFHSYAGLNDNNRKWLGAEASKHLVEEVLNGDKEITDDHLVTIAAKTGWKYEYLNNSCSAFDDDGNLIKRSKSDLIKAVSKIPYNKKLKTLIFKIEESFVKVSNRGSLYGKLIQERKAYETAKNEAGDYANQAKRILAEKKIGKDTDAYKAYSKGKLPKSHLQRRACRWAAKLFIAHLFEEMYRVHNGKAPSAPYPLVYQGHVDYIGPEVPFTREFDSDKKAA